MSLKPLPIGAIPEMTVQTARAAFRKGNLYLRLRDEMGTFYTDEDFSALYPLRGQPGLAPWRLALVTVMQFLENLSDRQAADAVRARIDWKYALGLELTDPGFDYSVLCQFRARLIAGAAEQILLDRLLEHFKEKGLLKARGKQRTDSTHVLAAIRTLNRLELVAETLRAALNDLAEAAPDWLRGIAPAEWYKRYGQRVDQWRLPTGSDARKQHAQTVGADGLLLLEALSGPEAPAELQELPIIDTLRQVWERHFERTAEGKARWRADSELGPAAEAVESPYDAEARHSTKRDTAWTGYRVHQTETCEADLPNIITHVDTTVATTVDVSRTKAIHEGLQKKDLLPGRHYVDTGYIDGELLVESQRDFGVDLFGPTRVNPSWQAREGGYDLPMFAIDWENEQVTCPNGKVSISWHAYTTKGYEYPLVKVGFSAPDCRTCADRSKCVRSVKPNKPRQLLLRTKAHHEALAKARSRMDSDEGRAEYGIRAGVEGTLSQGVRRCGLRRSRYFGLSKTHLQHLATAAAQNVARVIDYLEGKTKAKTRVSRLVRLAA